MYAGNSTTKQASSIFFLQLGQTTTIFQIIHIDEDVIRVNNR